MKYRNDIDGLRAIAVIAVIIFHLGFLPNGYLGVDVFFVISGFLITSIIFNQVKDKKFSILKFYEKRIRRIIPLLLFVTSLTFIIGLFLMLPDDLENLAQSVIASNFSANNILMLLTSADYWATLNEYKPLMHTWSLGIEEQFYFIYPFLLVLIAKINTSYIKNILLLLTLVSLSLFLFYGNEASKFYLIQYRFFELSFGGFAAIYLSNINTIKDTTKYLMYFSIIGLLVILLTPIASNQINVVAVTLLTVIILSTGKYFHSKDIFIKTLFQNKLFVFIGKISFSLYMWHQVVFALTRYAFLDEINFKWSILLVLLTLLLSIASYYFIENTFRNRKKIATKTVITCVASVFILLTVGAFYVYSIGGIYKDFPSLNLYKNDNNKREFKFLSSADNIHIHFNEAVRQLDKPFKPTEKTKILVVGNSYGRDVINILLKSSIADKVEVSYFDINRVKTDSTIKNRWLKADLVFIATKSYISKQWLKDVSEQYGFKCDIENVYCFGTKDFGNSNGIHYNRLNKISSFTDYYTSMKTGVLETEHKLKNEWSTHYVSLIEPLENKSSNEVLVFTPDGKFISQDTLHLTKCGAEYYAKILDDILNKILYIENKTSVQNKSKI